MANSVLVRVPASTANLGPGFDALGMALELYIYVELTVLEQGPTVIALYGDNLDGIPTDERNLIYKVAQQVFAEAGVSHPHLKLDVYSEIPLTRGLGSSASAIIAGMVAANALLPVDKQLSEQRLFELSSAMEGHPDNVGAALFGGIVAAFWDGSLAAKVKIVPSANLQTLVVVPSFQLSTEKARHALPKQLSMADAVFNIGHASVLVAALSTGQLDTVKLAMKDRLHQPYRMELVPGMRKILAKATDHGALGAALSGAGPTVIAFVDRTSSEASKKELEAFMVAAFVEQNIEVATHWLNPDVQGAQSLTVQGNQGTFIEKLKGAFGRD
jgi:homoserine kinase